MYNVQQASPDSPNQAVHMPMLGSFIETKFRTYGVATSMDLFLQEQIFPGWMPAVKYAGSFMVMRVIGKYIQSTLASTLGT